MTGKKSGILLGILGIMLIPGIICRILSYNTPSTLGAIILGVSGIIVECLLYYVWTLQGNWVLRGSSILLIIGTICNSTVTAVNGGWMPLLQGVRAKPGSPMSPPYYDIVYGGNLLFLADVLPFGFSIGDLFLIGGLALLGVGMGLLFFNRLKEKEASYAIG